jgi:Repeat of unknown function (DUF5648)
MGHLFSIDVNDITDAIRTGSRLEGVACYVYRPPTRTVPAPSPGTTEFRRWYNPGNRDHFFIFTDNADEKLRATPAGYREEGPACYVYKTPQQNTVPFYRLLSTVTREHFYTASEGERRGLEEGLEFTFEGIACHVFILGQAPADTVPLYRVVW